MNLRIATVIAMVLPFGWGSAEVSAQQPQNTKKTQIDAHAVVHNYLDKIGGIKAINQIESVTSKGTLSIPEAGIEGRMEHSQSHGRFLMCVEFRELGEIRIGCDGTNAWQINPQEGDKILNDTEMASALHDYGFPVPELDFVGNFRGKLQVVGEVEEGDETFVQIEATPNIGRKSVRLFDKRTGLLAKTISTKDIYGSEFEVTTSVSDYRSVGGVLFPHRLVASTAGQEQVLEIESIAIGKKVDESLFEIPASLKDIE